MTDSPPNIPPLPTIPDDQWRTMIAGCRDSDERLRILTAYSYGFHAHAMATFDALGAIERPEPPSEGGEK